MIQNRKYISIYINTQSGQAREEGGLFWFSCRGQAWEAGEGGEGGEGLPTLVLNDTSEGGEKQGGAHRHRCVPHACARAHAHTHTNPTRTQESLNCLTLIRKPTWDIPRRLPHCWEEHGCPTFGTCEDPRARPMTNTEIPPVGALQASPPDAFPSW